METQVPLDERFEIGQFSCVTMSNHYLAIGCKGRMMIFIIEGEHAGRWVCDVVHDPATMVEKLQFSADGRALVALLRAPPVASGSWQSKALIYSTETIEMENVDRQSPVTLIPESSNLEWDWELDVPKCIAFSGDGMTIAISTTSNAEGIAKIRLLKKVALEWRYLGYQSVPVFAPNERYGNGITGISL